MSELGNALRGATLPTPAAGEEDVIAAARREFPHMRKRAESARKRKVAAVALGLVVALVSPPGQAAVSWATDLIGIGDVGGPPTNSERPELAQPVGEQIVIGNGDAPDGTPFEIVAYRTQSPSAGNPEAGTACVFVDFPTSGASGSGSCGVPPLEQGRFLHVGSVSGPATSRGPSNPVVSGFVAESVDRVHVRVPGSETSTSTELIRVDAVTQERLGIPDVSFFLAFLPEEFRVEGLSDGSEELELTAYDRNGNLLARDVRGELIGTTSPPESLLDQCEESVGSGSGNDLCRELLEFYR
jgi:hypothetical protein